MPEFEAVSEWIETITPEYLPPKMPAKAAQIDPIQPKIRSGLLNKPIILPLSYLHRENN